MNAHSIEYGKTDDGMECVVDKLTINPSAQQPILDDKYLKDEFKKFTDEEFSKTIQEEEKNTGRIPTVIILKYEILLFEYLPTGELKAPAKATSKNMLSIDSSIKEEQEMKKIQEGLTKVMADAARSQELQQLQEMKFQEARQ